MQKGSRLYRFFFCKGVRLFSLGENSLVGVASRCIGRFKDRQSLNIHSGGRLVIGKDSVITQKHLFDMSGSILIGENVVIGGENSLFYTHSYDCFRNFSYGNIILQNDIYIGAKVLCLPGVKIASSIVIGAGAVISKSLLESGIYVGNPILKKSNEPKSKRSFVKKY